MALSAATLSAAALLTLALFACFSRNYFSDQSVRLERLTKQQPQVKQGPLLARHAETPATGQPSPVESWSGRRGRPQPARLLHRVAAPRKEACGLALESRFDCARDRVVSQTECEGRGCCYAPLPRAVSGGPPWCFYPSSYSGYRMGGLTPTPRGQAATLKRPTPSYLPRDIATLRLEVREETAGRLHLTVSVCGQ